MKTIHINLEKKQLVTTNGREGRMFISDRMAYLPIRLPTDEDMDSYPRVPLTPDGEWNPLDLDEDVQWDNSKDDARFGANVSDNSYTQ